MMESTARSSGSEHPLFADRDLLDEVTKVDVRRHSEDAAQEGRGGKSRQGAGPDRALIGGVSADDVLQEAT